MSPDLGPGSTFGPYRLESLLGRGGMSVVYLAEDTRLGRQVAIKVLAPELATDEAFRTRFIRESQLAAGLEHPNIVPVYEAGEHEQQLFIAMRYVRGTDLRTLVVREGPLEPHRTISLLRPVGAALDAAHRRGLVHRDVKPANILIAFDEGEEHVYLSDFGLTKHTSSRSGLTRTGQFMGTVDYVAPEQIQGHEVDGRTDGYSLACVLFECLTSHVPYAKDSDVATLFGHIQDPPPRPTAVRAALPEEIDEVIARGMAKDPAERPATCSSLIDEAGRALGAPSGPRETPGLGPTPTIVASLPPVPAGSFPPATGAPASVSGAPGAPAATPPSGAPVAAPSTPAPGPPGAPKTPRSGLDKRLIATFAGAGVAIATVIVVLGIVLSGDGGTPRPSPTPTTPPPPIELANAEPVSIPDTGTGAPYPSTIEVTGADQPISDVDITLEGLSHAFPDDLDVLLVGPSGESVVLMADVGGGTDNAVNDVTLTFDDDAASPVPDQQAIVAGSFRPNTGADAGGGGGAFNGPAPAPAPPFGSALTAFDGTDANGTWSLFVFDDTAGDTGDLARGWSIEIEMGGERGPTGPTGATGATGATGTPTPFSSFETITMPDTGPATPYPSEIQVSGLSGTVTDVNVSFTLDHRFANDVDVLLVGPTGDSVVLLADAGGSNPVVGTFFFDDAAPRLAPDERRLVPGRFFRPTSLEFGFEGPAPAPPPPFADQLAVFNGTDPNGSWRLFVFDDAGGDAGEITGGWLLEITVA